MTITLRTALPEDDAFLLSVFSASREAELGMLNWTSAQKEMFCRMQYQLQQGAYAAQYEQLATSIILDADVPVGSLTVSRAAESFTLVDIALLPTAQGRGIGSKVIQDLLSEAAVAKAHVSLSVFVTNVRARALYERLGFIGAATAEAHVRMQWKLPGAN